MCAEPSLVELKDVEQTYGSGERRFTAVHDVNLSLRDEEFVALLGPSGCGKSSLLRIITGLQRPSAGDVLYRGKLLLGVNPQATIVFQTFALFPWLTVLENVELALKMQEVPTHLRAARAIDLLDRVGLDGFESAYPRELSGGMRQKVGFARAMAVEPELLCLDEPFSALDVLSAESLRGELLELWLQGDIPTRAILMVSHNIEEAVLLADRIVVMDKNPGRIIAEIEVTLPHPRQRKSKGVQDLVDQVYALLAGQTLPEHLEMGTAPGEPGKTRRLPQVGIGNLIGLVERLADLPGNRADIFRLVDVFGIDSDEVLQLSDAAELLGFATIAQGDINLTSLGETFADASILARKEIFATRIRRVPVFHWLMNMLGSAERHRLRWNVVQAALELEFPPDQAESQLETVVNWGRYAEILAYDDDEEMLYLDDQPVV